eukprot:TRINITY_DN61534_c0_g1_i1.p1 TRINITY_DN61534_c0_g1~~TRINITY_DN61534_c0_g1_i1.p1  ORF type:complete len:470 (+),score=60.93 TRINITY_DN61534_c0_g1_i1:95-1504(+)
MACAARFLLIAFVPRGAVTLMSTHASSFSHECQDAGKARKHQSENQPQLILPCFEPGCQEWRDTDGERIEAHGAGILQSTQDGRWYWYGESAKRDKASGGSLGGGINCYSSASLAGPWKNEGEMLSQNTVTVPRDDGPFVVERPKVIFNTVTQKYVMWFHVDNSTYLLRHVGVATSEHPTGPFTFSHAFLPDGLNSLDMSLFKDYNGEAYFVRSVDNQYFAISGLSSDYMSTSGVLSTGNGFISGDQACLEGFAIFRHPFNAQGTLFMMTSHCMGWNPNPLSLLRADGPDLGSPDWKDLGNPTNDERSWNSQPAFVVQATTEDGEAYPVYIGDNWVYASERGLEDASYVWFPLQVNDDWTVRVEKVEAWDILRPHGQQKSDLLSACEGVEPICWLRLPGGCSSSLQETTTPNDWFIVETGETPSGCLKEKLRFTTACNSFAEYLWAPAVEGQPFRPATEADRSTQDEAE